MADVIAIVILADAVPWILYEKHQNCLQKIWDTSVLQRRQNHQRPPGGTQRQRSYNQEE